MTRTSNHDSGRLIAARRPFTGSNMSGETHEPGRYVYKGHLPERFAATLKDADYIVYSYSTPIAWHLADGWVCPPVSYSNSTAKHQGYARSVTFRDQSAVQEPYERELRLTPTQRTALRNLLRNNVLTTADYAKRTLDALVTAGFAAWSSDGDRVVPPPD